ncbi:MAG: hypothetical protein Q4P18_07655 [Methanobrevibacter sp.]|uniref:hypothetical protein n=1 Tax=Methanobrevibacter sp. TaxID=66852 RepID=UPI0026E0645A|nr:hypothetical protein [Methanobrevibacter sp.]MDO5849394.1 hypothetical protein [Methanobrevibacter sp.]
MNIDNSSVSKVDVRLIVSGPEMAELVSKSINNIDLETDYNIIVSSIIPTTDLEIAKKVADGADIILIGGSGHDETYNILSNELKDDYNHIGLFNYNNIIDDHNNFDYGSAKTEILNAIIKAGLTYSLNIVNIHTLENKLLNLTRKYNNLLDDYNQLIEENKVINQSNIDLEEEISNLEDTISNLKSNFSTFKARFEDIHKKDILEVFNLEKLWLEIFKEKISNEDKVVLATNKFKPEDIIIGQGYIGARDKQSAIEWLKIVNTSLMLLDNDYGSLKDELDDMNREENVDSENSSDFNISDNITNFFD